MAIRDEFSQAVRLQLAKRVCFLCSKCRRPTVGPSEEVGHSASIGVAAHITAAAPGGPRYNKDLDEMQRGDIDNGIWLCNNCATLIDKDPLKYTVEIIRKYKWEAEQEAAKKLSDGNAHIYGIPYLEIDFLRTGSDIWRSTGASLKNPIALGGGLPYLAPPNAASIQHWHVESKYRIVIINNSSYNGYNLSVDSIGDVHFSKQGSLPKKNNIAPLEQKFIDVLYVEEFEGTGIEIEARMRTKILTEFNAITLKLKYQDDKRNEHSVYLNFFNGEVIITRSDF